jgi:hypothetical protein
MRVRILVLGGLLLALAGCGTPTGDDQVSSAGGGSSSAAPTEERSEQEAVLDYAKCMRENGVPNFPDPELGDNGEARLNLPEGVDRAAADAANDKCKQHLPNGGEPEPMDPENIAKQRAYSKCMRENGVPKFPDPRPDGGIAIEGGPGLDPHSPEFTAADEKCKQHLPGGGRGGSFDEESGR